MTIYQIIENRYRNATHYESGRPPDSSRTLATTLSAEAAAHLYEDERQRNNYQKRYREGNDWHSFRCALGITEVRINPVATIPVGSETVSNLR